MPPTMLDRLPLPSMTNYVIASVTLATLALSSAYYHLEGFIAESVNATHQLEAEEIRALYENLTWADWSECLWLNLTSQLWTLWATVNMCYCLLTLAGKGVQVIVFGKLRVSETQQLKERFWNIVFYKFIFVFGVLNVQYMSVVFMWAAWFSLVCGLQLLADLSKCRYDYLSCSPTTPKSQHVKLIFLLILLTLLGFCLLAASSVVGYYSDWSYGGFMAADCFLLLIKSIYVIIKYTIYLVDLNHDGLWETRGTLAYYTDLVYDTLSPTVELLHSLHMLMWSEAFLSMANIVIFMQARTLFVELQKKYYKHKNYLHVVRSMEARFSEATADEITAYDDNCAICWDKMQRARKLPCGHLFHNSCLRSWLAQDISCPTCRVSLSDQKTEQRPTPTNEQATFENEAAVAAIDQPDAGAEGVAPAPVVRPRTTAPRVNRTNHLFHFDASRYISWLPSFSVEVTHTQLSHPDDSTIRTRSSIRTMARQVQDLFPSMNLTSIMADLRYTHSVEITIENILEGRIATRQPEDGEHEDDEETDDDSASEHMSEYTTDSSEEGEELLGAYALPPGHSSAAVPGHQTANDSLTTDEQSEQSRRRQPWTSADGSS